MKQSVEKKQGFLKFLLLTFSIAIISAGCIPNKKTPVETLEYMFRIGNNLIGKTNVTISRLESDDKGGRTVYRYQAESVVGNDNGESIYDSTFVELNASDLMPLTSRKAILNGGIVQVFTVDYDYEDSLITVMIKNNRQSFPYYIHYDRPLVDIQSIPFWLCRQNFVPGDTLNFEILSPSLASTIYTEAYMTGREEIDTGYNVIPTVKIELRMIEKPVLDVWKETTATLATYIDSLTEENGGPEDVPKTPTRPEDLQKFRDGFFAVFGSEDEHTDDKYFRACVALMDKLDKASVNRVNYWISDVQEGRFVVKFMDKQSEAMMLLIERKLIDEKN